MDILTLSVAAAILAALCWGAWGAVRSIFRREEPRPGLIEDVKDWHWPSR